MPTVHVIGAGIAGLACAVRLARQGRAVAVHEAAPQAGGRCRSFFDRGLGRRIDNGNHLLLSANRAALAFLGEIGAADSLTGPAEPAFPFTDLDTGERWVVRPGAGPLPWWLLDRSRRVPGTRLRDYLSGLRLALAGPAATVADCVAPDHPLYRAFWEPLTLAVLNAPPDRAAARPMGRVLAEAFGRGGDRCRPLVARDGLADSFVDPAVAVLGGLGAPVQFGRRLRALDFADGRVTALHFAEDMVRLADDDAVVLAVPPSIAATLVPGLAVPAEGNAILNAHFRLDTAPPPALPYGSPFLGLLGGAAQWVFVRGDVASVTVSAADGLIDRPAPELAALLWRDVARALGQSRDEPPAARVIKERRATFVQTPENLRRRPAPRTAWRNLVLAGDWTATGLPATIEGAARSGHAAAAAAAGLRVPRTLRLRRLLPDRADGGYGAAHRS
jgi:squalene-associated FAD-dependent desaturase